MKSITRTEWLASAAFEALMQFMRWIPWEAKNAIRCGKTKRIDDDTSCQSFFTAYGEGPGEYTIVQIVVRSKMTGLLASRSTVTLHLFKVDDSNQQPPRHDRSLGFLAYSVHYGYSCIVMPRVQFEVEPPPDLLRYVHGLKSL